ncbi:MAG: glycosyltransferase family 4 protein [Bacteroidales bacterium]|nr:glycosyltransferase family 4 protein [Bacteroidales bacterium]
MAIKVLVISDYRNYITARPEAEIFIGLAKMGFQIYIMTYKEAELVKEFEAVGIKVIDFHPKKKFDKSEIQRIRETLIEKEIDIVHLFNNPAIVKGIRASKGLKVKVVLYRGYAGNIHWYDPFSYLKFLHPRVDKIFCNSMGVEEFIQKQLLFNKNKTITINKGHNLNWYADYPPYGIKKELGLAPDTFLLINVANNRRMKGIPYLLKAINNLPKELPIHLLLVGRDMDTKENLRIIEKGGSKKRVHIIGFRKNVLNIVSACDVFVLSSIKGESITKSVIEAMSLGLAPIISDIPGNKELVINEESGLITRAKKPKELSNAILRLYENKSLREGLGRNAKKRIDSYLNINQTILKTKQLYEELVANKNRR